MMRLVLCAALALPLWGARPVAYYTDLTSGPSVPANGGSGVAVRIYGRHFGETRGASTVTLAGVEPSAYVSWSDTVVVVRLGSGNAAGVDLPLLVRVDGYASNTLPFRVDNAKRIFYFDPAEAGNGGDTCSSPRAGTEAAPWRYLRQNGSTRSLTYFFNTCLATGDVLYVRAGTIDRSDDQGWQAVFTIGQNSSVVNQAVVAYPGEVVTLDGAAASASGATINYAVREKSAGTSGYTIAGFAIVGVGIVGIDVTSAPRLVGNVVSGANLCTYAGIEVVNGAAKVLGNEVTGVSTGCTGGTGAQKLMHSMYMKCSGCEVAWNHIHDNKTYNGIQFHDDALIGSGGYRNISIHDNVITGQWGSAINLGTIDFADGSDYVRIYNNVLAHAGAVALVPSESSGQIKGCLVLKDQGRTAAAGTVDAFNNTMVDCTGLFDDVTWGNTDTSGAIYKGGGQASVSLNIRNNIIYAPAYYWTDAARGASRQNSYVAKATTTSYLAQISGTNNIWYGQGSFAPSTSYGTVANPGIADATSDFSLTSASAAYRAGVLIAGLTLDIAGATRPVPPSVGSYDVHVPPAGTALRGIGLRGVAIQ